MQRATDNIDASVYRKLSNMLGDARARTLVTEVLAELGLTHVRTPDERRRFGETVMKRGGVFEVLGRSIQTQAILHGAGLLG